VGGGGRDGGACAQQSRVGLVHVWHLWQRRRRASSTQRRVALPSAEPLNKTELVELRVYVRQGGKLKYELDGLRWKSSLTANDGSGEGPPPGELLAGAGAGARGVSPLQATSGWSRRGPLHQADQAPLPCLRVLCPSLRHFHHVRLASQAGGRRTPVEQAPACRVHAQGA
jgi:hypothetical protein